MGPSREAFRLRQRVPGEDGLRKAHLVTSTPRSDECRHWLFYPDTLERSGVGCTETREPLACRPTGEFEYMFGGG